MVLAAPKLVCPVAHVLASSVPTGGPCATTASILAEPEDRKTIWHWKLQVLQHLSKIAKRNDGPCLSNTFELICCAWTNCSKTFGFSWNKRHSFANWNIQAMISTANPMPRRKQSPTDAPCLWPSGGFERPRDGSLQYVRVSECSWVS